VAKKPEPASGCKAIKWPPQRQQTARAIAASSAAGPVPAGSAARGPELGLRCLISALLRSLADGCFTAFEGRGATSLHERSGNCSQQGRPDSLPSSRLLLRYDRSLIGRADSLSSIPQPSGPSPSLRLLREDQPFIQGSVVKLFFWPG